MNATPSYKQVSFRATRRPAEPDSEAGLASEAESAPSVELAPRVESDRQAVKPAREATANLLIVDDDERVAELMAVYLDRLGYSVRTASSFSQARIELSAGRPDLLLSDIELGPECALEELPRLREAGLLPPTLVVSGFLDRDIAAELLEMPQVLGLLPKPFDFPDLADRLRTCLAQISEEGMGAEPPAEVAPEVALFDEQGWIEIVPGRPAGASSDRSPAPSRNADQRHEGV